MEGGRWAARQVCLRWWIWEWHLTAKRSRRKKLEKKAIKMWKKKWTVSNASQRKLLGCTVVIRFSTRGAYLLLVRKGRAVIRDRVLISSSRNRRICETELVVYLKTIKKIGKRACCLSIFPGESEKPTKSFVWKNCALIWIVSAHVSVEAINELLKEGKPRLISIYMYMYPNSAIRIGRLVK